VADTAHAGSRRGRGLRGRVVSGRGIASSHLNDEMDEFVNATGERLIAGSLNVLLEEPILFDTNAARIASNGKRLLWRAAIGETPVWIYRFPHAQLHVAEVLSQTHLRSAFSLEDGDEVSLIVPQNVCIDLGSRERTLWKLFWLGRESWPYRRDSYYSRLKRLSIDLGITQDQRKRVSTIKAIRRFVLRGFR
jgi:hypothetical protein